MRVLTFALEVGSGAVDLSPSSMPHLAFSSSRTAPHPSRLDRPPHKTQQRTVCVVYLDVSVCVCVHTLMFVLSENMWVLDVTVGEHVYECVCQEKCM